MVSARLRRVRIAGEITDWVDRVVIGLNLCPFARPVRDQIHIAVVEATDPEAASAALHAELVALAESTELERATTLLALPGPLFEDFLDFNEFLEVVDAMLVALDLVGQIQVPSFHPRYRFHGEPEGSVSHFTNRAPYPILHLLREEDVTAAVAAHPDPAAIPHANIARLQSLSEARLRDLFGVVTATS